MRHSPLKDRSVSSTKWTATNATTKRRRDKPLPNGDATKFNTLNKRHNAINSLAVLDAANIIRVGKEDGDTNLAYPSNHHHPPRLHWLQVVDYFLSDIPLEMVRTSKKGSLRDPSDATPSQTPTSKEAHWPSETSPISRTFGGLVAP